MVHVCFIYSTSSQLRLQLGSADVQWAKLKPASLRLSNVQTMVRQYDKVKRMI